MRTGAPSSEVWYVLSSVVWYKLWEDVKTKFILRRSAYNPGGVTLNFCPPLKSSIALMIWNEHCSKYMEENGLRVFYTWLYNDNQTVMVKMLFSCCIFNVSIVRILSKNAIESPLSVHLYDVVRSILCYFIDLESSIE